MTSEAFEETVFFMYSLYLSSLIVFSNSSSAIISFNIYGKNLFNSKPPNYGIYFLLIFRNALTLDHFKKLRRIYIMLVFN